MYTPLDNQSCEVLVLYLERPGTQVRSWMVLAGRFGYSDLKSLVARDPEACEFPLDAAPFGQHLQTIE